MMMTMSKGHTLILRLHVLRVLLKPPDGSRDPSWDRVCACVFFCSFFHHFFLDKLFTVSLPANKGAPTSVCTQRQSHCNTFQRFLLHLQFSSG